MSLLVMVPARNWMISTFGTGSREHDGKATSSSKHPPRAWAMPPEAIPTTLARSVQGPRTSSADTPPPSLRGARPRTVDVTDHNPIPRPPQVKGGAHTHIPVWIAVDKVHWVRPWLE